MNIQPQKLTLSAWNQLLLHTLGFMFSASGLLTLFATVFLGGGSIFLLLTYIPNDKVNYYLLQPAILVIYVIFTLARNKSGGITISSGYEFRNFLVSILTGLVITALMSIIIFGLQHYIFSEASAAVTGSHTVSEPLTFIESSGPSPSKAFGIPEFTGAFKAFSVIYFMLFTLVPGCVLFLAMVSICEGPLRKNIGMIFMASLQNVQSLVILSFISFCILSIWSYCIQRNEVMVFLSVFPLVYLTLLTYVIAEQIFIPWKRLHSRKREPTTSGIKRGL